MPPPKRRRQQGTGTVFQRESDGRWIGALYSGWTKSGARRRITVSCTAEQGEAHCKKLLTAKQRELIKEGGSGLDPRTTVKAWSDIWLDRTKLEIRPKSWASNRSAVRVWIVPTIGHKRLTALTPADVRSVSTAIRGAGRSSSTALRAHVNLNQMLTAAILEGHQINQRILLVDAPGKAVSDRSAIELTDAIKLLQTAALAPDGSRWAAALLQGMRQGECLGLTWPCVDLNRGLLDVSWQLQALPYAHGCEKAGKPTCGRRFGGDCPTGFLQVPDGYEYRQLDGRLCLVRPKSAKGHRVIPLVPWMTTALTGWRTVAPPSRHGLVWPRADGQPRRAKDDSEAWQALQTAAAVRSGRGDFYVEHEARHTTATLLLEAGTDPKVITEILGHASILTSQIYQHVSHDLARSALDGLAGMLQLGPGGGGTENA